MNVLLKQLTRFVLQYPWQEKLLVVRSRAHGYQLMESLAREGVAWLNLRPGTPLGLAMEIVEADLKQRQLEVITHLQALYLLHQITAAMHAKGELIYFKTIFEAGFLNGLLLPSIRDLRLATVQVEDILPDCFVDLQKGYEFKQIFNAYDLALEANNFADEAIVYARAGCFLEKDLGSFKHKRLLIPQQLELSHAAFQFLNQFTSAIDILAEEPVVGLKSPFPHRFELAEPQPAESGLNHIYDLSETTLAPNDIEIFKAYGEGCEVQEVLRRIKTEGHFIDQVLLCCTRDLPYLSLIYSEALRLEIPITFAHGTSALNTRPGQLLTGILNWIKANYPVSIIYRLVVGGDINIVPAMDAAQLLRGAGIGWGKDNYEKCLGVVIEDLNNKLEKAHQDNSEQRSSILSKQLDLAERVQVMFQDMVGKISLAEQDGMLDLSVLCQGLAQIIKTYSRVDSELDGIALQVISEQLEQIQLYYPVKMEVGPALRVLDQVLGGPSVGGEGPQAGCLYVAGVEDAMWTNRPHTYLLGMDAGKMEGRMFQDPVLLDCERKAISLHMEVKRNHQPERVYQVTNFIASRRGPITFSFPSYDVAENRPCLPSALLLQVYRLISGQSKNDYSSLMNYLKDSAVYFPTTENAALDGTEWWLAQALNSPLRKIKPDDVVECFPGLKRGLTALQDRDSDEFTEYDGKLTTAVDRLDPRLDHTKTLSASALETMAKCPFSYFLKYILRIQAPEDMKVDTSIWLDAMQRGSLLHSIYCDYQREVYGPGKKNLTDKKLLLDIAEREIEAIRLTAPPPDPLIYLLEKEDLLRGLEVYCFMLEAKYQTNNGLPVYSEVPFGLGADEVETAGIGVAEPVTINVPGGGSFLLRGRIDRIDAQEGSTYEIWDFKTGSTFGYQDRGFVKAGQQIQHLLYSIAAEQILASTHGDSSIRVDMAGYLFPTEKGAGKIIIRHQAQRDKGLQAIEKVLDLMSQGVFCASSSRDSCSYCDYRPVCRSTNAVEAINLKLGNEANACLQSWKELQDYE